MNGDVPARSRRQRLPRRVMLSCQRVEQGLLVRLVICRREMLPSYNLTQVDVVHGAEIRCLAVLVCDAQAQDSMLLDDRRGSVLDACSQILITTGVLHGIAAGVADTATSSQNVPRGVKLLAKNFCQS